MDLVRIDEFLDGGLELGHAAERAATNLLSRQGREPALDETQPRSVRRREMHVEPRPLREPMADERRLVGAVIVHDDVHVKRAWHLRVN